MIENLKELIEIKEKLNGFYLGRMKMYGFLPDAQSSFISIVEERFNSTLSEVADHADHYEKVIRYTFTELVKFHNKQQSKMEKKNLKNRGTVIWNTKEKGQYVKK